MQTNFTQSSWAVYFNKLFFPMYPQLLTGQKATPEHASNLLDKLFNTPDPKRDPVILLVDEVRACTTRKRTIRSVLFCVCYRQCQHCWNIRTILLAILRAMFFQHRPWIVVRSLTRKKSGKQYPGILGLNFCLNVCRQFFILSGIMLGMIMLLRKM